MLTFNLKRVTDVTAEERRLDPTAQIFQLPDPTKKLESWQDLITYILTHPEVIALLLQALLALLGAASPQQKRP